jgi:hypothetical protein
MLPKNARSRSSGSPYRMGAIQIGSRISQE